MLALLANTTDADKASICFAITFIACVIFGAVWIVVQKPHTVVVWLMGLFMVAVGIGFLGFWIGTP